MNNIKSAWLELEIRQFSDYYELDNFDISILYHKLHSSWMFYDDYIADRDTSLPRYPKFDLFISDAIDNIDSLKPLKSIKNEIIPKLKNYGSNIPRCGCILLNSSLDKILLGKNFSCNSYTICAGKLNEGEAKYVAAIRETKEETDFDATDYIDTDLIIIKNINRHTTYLYIIPNVPENYLFQPNTRKEVQGYKWFDINQLNKPTCPITTTVRTILPDLLQIIHTIKSNKKRKK